MLLEIRGLTKNFGGLIAVDQFSMSVGEGQIVGLIGPNGAGKTTVFNLITGVLRPSAGKVEFDGKDVTGKSPAHLGESRHWPHFPANSTVHRIHDSRKCGRFLLFASAHQLLGCFLKYADLPA